MTFPVWSPTIRQRMDKVVHLTAHVGFLGEAEAKAVVSTEMERDGDHIASVGTTGIPFTFLRKHC